jgi:hypothetical protein
MKPNPCIYSSMVFAINATVSYWYGYFLYSALFAFLLVTSVIHHSTKTIYTYLVDKLAVFCVIFYGAYLFYNKIRTGNINWLLASSIVLTFLSTIYLYYYGYAHKKYCFASDAVEAELFHCIMHLVASAGHLMIVFL